MLWLTLLLFVPILVGVIWGKIRKFIEAQTIEFALKKLNDGEAKVIRNLVLAGAFIDYLVISQAGVAVIKKCSFRKHNSFLIGDEEARVWKYYEPYGLNPKGPSIESLQGVTVGNANRIPLNNPIIECERVINSLQGTFNNKLYRVEFHPIILLTPKIKGVNLHRKKETKAKIVFANSLKETLTALDATLIPLTELDEVKNKILSSAGARMAG